MKKADGYAKKRKMNSWRNTERTKFVIGVIDMTNENTLIDSTSSMDYKKHPVVILFGMAFIGFCLWLCTIIIYSVFDGAFLSMGGVVMIGIAPMAAFGAFGMVRFLTYADNAAEAWAALPAILSAIALCISGMTVIFFAATFLSDEVEYRSLNLEGYKFLYIMILLPLFMAWHGILTAKPGQIPSSKKRSLDQFIKQNWLKEIIVTGLLYIVLTVSAYAILALSPPIPLFEEHLSYEEFYRRDGFPADGSDFCYTRASHSFYCDFELSGESFQCWVKTRTDWETYCISSDKPVTVGRDKKLEITNGLVSTLKPEEGVRVDEQAVFDRDNNRVYYYRLVN